MTMASGPGTTRQSPAVHDPFYLYFHELCCGANGYVCDPYCLVNLPINDGEGVHISSTVQKIKEKLDESLLDLEFQRNGEVKSLYIGKVGIKQRKKKGGLDRMDPTTWITKGIGSHWRKHKLKGRDGMIVLTAITKETTPNDIDQQEYALEIQQKLIESYKTDPRLQNKSRGGGKQSLIEDGYVLFVAFNVDGGNTTMDDAPHIYDELELDPPQTNYAQSHILHNEEIQKDNQTNGPPCKKIKFQDEPDNVYGKASLPVTSDTASQSLSPQQQKNSILSCTTVGGCAFEDLCKGAVDYACDPSCLVDLSKTDAVDKIVQLLAEKLEKIIKELERERDGEVTKIYIGKTYIRQRRKRGGGFQQFDPMQPTTWKKSGISSRWGSHKALGRHGLIVLTAVTRKLVPKGTSFDQEGYTLMLESRLMQHYKLINDTRLENETGNEGSRSKETCYGYALYVALTIEENDASIFNDDNNDHDDNAGSTDIGLPYTTNTSSPTLSAIAGSSIPQFTERTKHIPGMLQ